MRKCTIAFAAVGALGWSQAALADDASWSLHGFGDVSVKNDYITPRGLVVTTKGTTIQVLNGLVLVSPGGVAVTAGTWTDLNPGYRDGNITSLNEFDFFVGVSAPITSRLEAGVQYVQFVSGQPSVAFKDERNIEFSLKYKDGAKGAPVTINPYAKFFWAVDGDSTVVLGKKGDTFDIELGAVPTYAGKGFTLSAPTWITVGPKTYWGAKGNPLAVEGQNFGVVSIGLKAAMPLTFIKGAAGASVYVQGQYYHLINDNLVTSQKLLNSGRGGRDKFVGAVGISFGF
ncbi:hypothetical protein H7F51_11320 [Novosphingobium flavum]|uniref:Outer membrane protein n=1 Tax=Novosphingobium flavum TaxID=1778672 RepID=A0A7X1FTB7_9SPHN|nr:hypothetical protein [Novosphingobium flavum]MBC2666107.1 hypothetical protein [Novosphingobium flavum]